MQRMEEQGLSPLECSSGCESGWTMYLDQSSEKPTSLFEKEAVLSSKNDRFLVGGEGEDEMDPSMVSDASSGPPHFLQDDDDEDHEFCFDGDGCFCSPAFLCKSGKRRRAERRGVEEEDPSSFLDDTASSHVFSLSNVSGPHKAGPFFSIYYLFFHCFWQSFSSGFSCIFTELFQYQYQPDTINGGCFGFLNGILHNPFQWKNSIAEALWFFGDISAFETNFKSTTSFHGRKQEQDLVMLRRDERKHL